jgi:hypothetical protein
LLSTNKDLYVGKVIEDGACKNKMSSEKQGAEESNETLAMKETESISGRV